MAESRTAGHLKPLKWCTQLLVSQGHLMSARDCSCGAASAKAPMPALRSPLTSTCTAHRHSNASPYDNDHDSAVCGLLTIIIIQLALSQQRKGVRYTKSSATNKLKKNKLKQKQAQPTSVRAQPTSVRLVKAVSGLSPSERPALVTLGTVPKCKSSRAVNAAKPLYIAQL